ncbi:MAG: 30S ribosomal protein S6e [Candidatus Altiarchaeota archaeon]|nr:30S ribosomal protein S6e [Candidatus Altiarchaeota archaeon]
MECTVVVGTKGGNSYNIEAKDEQARVFLGKRIGDTVNVTPLGLKGYEVRITGGSDKSGFPMRSDAHLSGRAKALLSSKSTGYKPLSFGARRRKTVMGNVVTEQIAQINTTVLKEGKDPIEKLLGKTEEGGKPPETEEKKEAKPAAGKKPEPPKKTEKKESASGETKKG